VLECKLKLERRKLIFCMNNLELQGLHKLELEHRRLVRRHNSLEHKLAVELERKLVAEVRTLGPEHRI